MDGEGLAEGLADGHAGVEGGVGVLEDDGELAAEVAHLGGGDVEEVELAGLAVGVERAKEDAAAGGFDEAKNEAGDGAFTRAGFADEAEGFAAVELQRDVVDDARGTVVLDEVVGFEKRLVRHAAPE